MTDPITLAVVSVFAILALFLIVMAVGDPIPEFGNVWLSAVYAVLVYVPVAVVCVFALRKAKS